MLNFQCDHPPFVHVRTGCPHGCHDDGMSTMDHPALFIMNELLEQVANDGELGDFHREPDRETGYDGLDEIVGEALQALAYSEGG